MSIADKMQLGPKREEIELHNHPKYAWEIRVTPNPIFGVMPTVSVKLTGEQYVGYRKWRNGMFIQDALPDLPPSVREMLMTGLGDDDFHNFAIAQDEEDDDD